VGAGFACKVGRRPWAGVGSCPRERGQGGVTTPAGAESLELPRKSVLIALSLVSMHG